MVSRCSCYIGGPTLPIFGATRSHSSSRTGSAPSRRTCVASGAPIVRKEWPRIPPNAVADAVGILDALGIDAADVVADDWGAGVAWLTATGRPIRVRRLVVLSVPHPLAPYTLRQREMAWYQLFFQFEGIAEAWLQQDNWALFREMLRGNGDVDRYISDLSRPDALKASLNWYRANLAPRLPKSLPKLPSLEAPTLGIWSSNDHYLDGERMKISGRFVKGPWRYEQIDDASHWIPLDAPDRLNQLLLEWLG